MSQPLVVEIVADVAHDERAQGALKPIRLNLKLKVNSITLFITDIQHTSYNLYLVYNRLQCCYLLYLDVFNPNLLINMSPNATKHS